MAFSLRKLFTRRTPPQTRAHAWHWYTPDAHINLPIFVRGVDVPSMMRDARIILGLGVIKGTVHSKTRFYIDDPDSGEDEASYSPHKQWLIRQLETWWQTAVWSQMTNLEWGYSASEVLWRRSDSNVVDFAGLILQSQTHSWPVLVDGELVGMDVDPMLPDQSMGERHYIGGPKKLWSVHWPEYNPWYGRSRLLGAYPSWMESNMEGGARAVRRLYFYKKAFWDVLHHPDIAHDAEGNTVAGNIVAHEIVEKIRTGGSCVLPSARDENGNLLWFFGESPTASSSPEDLIGYVDELKKEMLEGIGVPEEVIMAAETGSGFSGRRIPQQAFLGMLNDIATNLVKDIDEQCFRPVIPHLFGIEPAYRIIPFGLLEDPQAEEGEPGEEDEAGTTEGTPSNGSSEPRLSLVV